MKIIFVEDLLVRAMNSLKTLGTPHQHNASKLKVTLIVLKIITD